MHTPLSRIRNDLADRGSAGPAHPGARRSPAFAFFCTYAAFVAYATLLPFQFFTDTAALRAKADWINWNPLYLTTGEPTPITDLVANVLFFLPVGFLGVHGQRRRPAALLVARSALAGCALSLLVEVLQFFTPTRNPATSDLITNTTGAALGAALAVFFRGQVQGPLLRRAGAWARREPLLPLLAADAVLVAVAAFVPFDFGLSVSHLRAALRRAEIGVQAGALVWMGEIPWMLQFAVLSGIAWHAARRSASWHAASRLVVCAVGIGAFAAALEVGQLLVRSHTTTLRDALAAFAGIVTGITAAALLGRARRAHLGWGLVGAAAVGCLTVQALVPFDFDWDLAAMRQRIGASSFVPYSSYYYKATVAAVADFLDGLLAFVPLGVVLARGRCRDTTPRLAAAAVVVAQCAVLAVALELLQLGVPRRYPEVSDVLTAALGGGLGAFAWRWYAMLGAAAIGSAPSGSMPAAGAEATAAPSGDGAAADGDPAIETISPASS